MAYVVAFVSGRNVLASGGTGRLEQRWRLELGVISLEARQLLGVDHEAGEVFALGAVGTWESLASRQNVTMDSHSALLALEEEATFRFVCVMISYSVTTMTKRILPGQISSKTGGSNAYPAQADTRPGVS
jgi:hypothetical protein